MSSIYCMSVPSSLHRRQGRPEAPVSGKTHPAFSARVSLTD